MSETQKTQNPLVAFKEYADSRAGEFKAALPAHIPAERFLRVMMTAIQLNPRLLECERRSLFTSAIQAAQDGLLPDGREGALVPYDDKKRGLISQWMPMIAGLRKKVRNSGEIATWNAEVVRKGDVFEFQKGDDPYIKHVPSLDNEDEPIIAAYSIAVLKSGEKSREVMSIGAIEKIRDRSQAWQAFKAKKIWTTPWETDRPEMCRKTVARRHGKVLPMSTDLDDLVRRDDALYDFAAARQDAEATEQPRRRRTLTERMGALAEPTQRTEFDPDTGEVIAEHEKFETPNGPDREQAEEIYDRRDGKQVDDEALHELARQAVSLKDEAIGEMLGEAHEQPSSDFPGDRPAPAAEPADEAPKRRGRPPKARTETETVEWPEGAGEAGGKRPFRTPEEEPRFGRSRSGVAFLNEQTAKLYSMAVNGQVQNGPDKLKWWLGRLSEPDWKLIKPFADEINAMAEELSPK